jgi:hypothetical protein
VQAGQQTYRKLRKWKKWLLNYARNANMPTPVRACDYDEKGECAETVGVNEVAQPRKEASGERKTQVRLGTF